jgi:hypothetical protein
MAHAPAILVAGLLTLGSCVPVRAESKKDEAEGEPQVVYTNEDLRRVRSSPGSAPAARPPEPIPVEIPSYATYRDRNGHGEGWWRQRAAELDLRILEAGDRAQRLHVAFVRGKTLTDPTLAQRSQEATKALLRLEAERDGLPEELRQAGGLPGWLRRGSGVLPTEPLAAPLPKAASHTGLLGLFWQAVPQAASYLVELQCLDCCGPIGACDVQSRDVSDTRAQFAFEAGRSGRWRVRALDAAGFAGAWSEWREFVHSPR